MGQSAIGVMYGCRLPEGLDVSGEDSDGPDLISEGTQGQWLIIHASRGDESLGVWWMGINMLNQMKRGL